MNDPHVEWLLYGLELGSTLSIAEGAPAVEHETDHFRLRLDAGKLTVTMKEHHATVESAQNRVQPVLRSWELENALKYDPGAFRFVFQDGKLVDRNPPPPGSSRTIAAATGAIRASAHVVAFGSVGRRDYPPPPVDFVASPDVETLWLRYRMYREGKEPLVSMAYVCLTLVEALALGSRKRAAKMLKVEFEILKTLGHLVTNKGDATTARKVPVSRVFQPLHPQEEGWIHEVVRARNVSRKMRHRLNAFSDSPPRSPGAAG